MKKITPDSHSSRRDLSLGMVFRKKNYDNSFDGISDGRATIDGSSELPVGTYFYVLKLQDRKDLAGAFYINR